MNASFTRNIERAFWNVAIPAMDHNRLLRWLIQSTYSLFHNRQVTSSISTISTAAVIGFGTGVLFRFLLVVLR